MEIVFRPIGHVSSPFKDVEGMPIQPAAARGITGEVRLLPEYAPGLRDLEGFSHIYLIYHLHRVGEAKLKVIPFLDTQPRGIFATRAPCRPNAVGISVVRLIKIEPPVLTVENIDILDETPLLDIKPYVADFDDFTTSQNGWYDRSRAHLKNKKSDGRFR